MMLVAVGLAASLTAEDHADDEEEHGDGGVGEATAQCAVAHAEGGVKEPDGRAEKPDPVVVAAHCSFGCDAHSLSYLVAFW